MSETVLFPSIDEFQGSSLNWLIIKTRIEAARFLVYNAVKAK
ncbi:MAG: hypothetical protein QGD88_01450 [Anaerolineae bacterium]|nr:hypothetical protein [Anaerolineae bacterium]